MYDTMTANLAVNIDDVAVALNSTQHSILLKSKDPYPKGPFRIHKNSLHSLLLVVFPSAATCSLWRWFDWNNHLDNRANMQHGVFGLHINR